MQNRSTRTGLNYTAVIGLTRGLMKMTDVSECAISKARYVGIFWFVREGERTSMIYDRTPVAMAEPYGDFATHPKGHYRYWEALKRRGSASLKRSGIPEAPAWFEYEEFPRGRVVYNRTTERFIVYVDAKLRRHSFIKPIEIVFGLGTGTYNIEGDEHYRSSQPLLMLASDASAAP
jgi:hypothetical protein